MMKTVILCALVALVSARAPLRRSAEADIIADQYIVVMADGVTAADRDAILAQDSLTKTNLMVRHSYNINDEFIGFSMTGDYEALMAVRDMPGVAMVETDGLAYINEVTEIVQEDSPSWGTVRVSEREHKLDGRTIVNEKQGEGVDVYIIDTGLNVDHVDFYSQLTKKTRASLGYWPANDPIHDDCNGHGTHVAGTAAGQIYGLAKEATLISVKVLGCGGSGAWSEVIAGIDYTTAKHQESGRASVANMSLGGGNMETVDAAVRASVAAGVTQVIAAGNNNGDACNGSPNRVAEAITVGSTAIGASDTDVRSSFSNWGPCTDVWAPGTAIQSAWIGSDTAENTISGTSMAAPHVAGAAALWFGKYGKNTPDTVRSAIESQSTPDKITLNCPSFGNCNDSHNRMLYSRL